MHNEPANAVPVRRKEVASQTMFTAVVVAAACLSVVPVAAAPALPATFPVQADAAVASAPRTWTIADIAQVARITSIAVQGRGTVAFIVEQPSVQSGETRYAIYVTGDRPGPARKLLEASFLADLTARPSSVSWAVRADLGKGVQLYEIGASGRARGLVINSTLAQAGGSDGQVNSSSLAARPTGVLSYGWSPTGTALWYSRLKLPSDEERARFEEAGVVFDEVKMYSADFKGPPAAVTVELHLLDVGSGKDRVISVAPGDRAHAGAAFGATRWIDAHRLAYRTDHTDEKSERSIMQWMLDTRTGKAGLMPGKDAAESFYAVRTADGALGVRRDGDAQRLVARADDGTIAHDYGEVRYTRLTSGGWKSEATGQLILGVHYPGHDGLAFVPSSPDGGRIEQVSAHLENCAFTADLSFGACSRESLDRAPELVSVAPETGEILVLARPNARYDAIVPLKVVAAEWINRFGAKNTGYVTYPREYQPGRKYPAILVTHGSDAQNRYAYPGFQWDYPIQSFAEGGYFVLSVNEARKGQEVADAQMTFSAALGVGRMQFETVFNVVASMEAAAQDLVDQGLVDPERIGIAGYSRGSSVTTFTLSQSKLFRVGSSGDAPWYSSNGYWSGSVLGKGAFQVLFGGSPLDPKAFENYLAISPSARADKFTGPLLQQYTAEAAPRALELHRMLRDAAVPTDLVFYRDETHLFHKPRTRTSAMQLNLDWFDYWLLDRRDPDPAKAEQYRRWDAMAVQWKEKQAAPAQ